MAASEDKKPDRFTPRQELPSPKDAYFFALVRRGISRARRNVYLSFIVKICSILWKSILFVFISDYPEILRAGRSFEDNKALFWPVAIITFFFCIVMTTVFCAWSGTLYGHDPSRFYFLRDSYNIILYIFVCPVYVGLGIMLLSTVLNIYFGLRSYSTELPNQFDTILENRLQGEAKSIVIPWFTDYATKLESKNIRVRFVSLFVVTLFATSIFIVIYLDSLKSISVSYWFFDGVYENGAVVRYMNKAGVYYLLLNSALLFITLLCACSFLTISNELIKISNLIGLNIEFFRELIAREKELQADKSKNTDKRDQFPRIFLRDYNWCYVLAKGMLVAYGLNIILWSASPAGASATNVGAAIVLLILFGVFIVPLPRLHFDDSWHYVVGNTSEDYFDSRYAVHRKLLHWANIAFALEVGIIYTPFKVLVDFPGKLFGG